MLSTYHNHSTWSDGKTPIAELVHAARAMGIDELGVSDHFNLHPSKRTPSWAMDPERLDDYIDDVRSHQTDDGPAIRLGLEVDWFPEREHDIRAALRDRPFDYLIGSVHEVEGFRIDSTPEDWNALGSDEQNEKHRLYWRRKRTLAESGLFDIVAHIDLSKKFGHYPTIDLSREIGEALDAIAEAKMIVELNTAGWHKPCRDAYPTLDILRECRKRDIDVTLSADAHEPEHLLRDFIRGVDRLADAGFDRIARFRGREIVFEPLKEAAPA